jgi:hypothetical protein
MRRKLVDLLDVENDVALHAGDGLPGLFAGLFILLGAVGGNTSS